MGSKRRRRGYSSVCGSRIRFEPLLPMDQNHDIRPLMTSNRSDSKAGHSEDYFGAYRDHWWNADYVELLAKRMGWASRCRVLEVGCGAGHWTRVFARHLTSNAKVTCVDSDPKWSDPAQPWAETLRSGGLALEIGQADARSLPFPDGAFDFVTCQTVLIHVVDPRNALAEMIRVLEPGGLLVCVEPDNFAGGYAAETSLSRSGSLEDDVAGYRLALAQSRGRIARGLGNFSLGGRLPGLFAAAGLADIRTYLSDRALALFPPYGAPEQKALINDIEQWFESGHEFTKDETRRNFLAGGGQDSEFDDLWVRELARREQLRTAIREKTYDDGGGPLLYVVAGSKP